MVTPRGPRPSGRLGSEFFRWVFSGLGIGLVVGTIVGVVFGSAGIGMLLGMFAGALVGSGLAPRPS